MGLLIDGYNLLWGGGTTLRPAPRSSHAPTPLARAREALLELLVDLIPPGRRKRTQIVFDAANAPVGLPKVRLFEGVEVIFARDYADADALLEELIERSSAPRGLTVVSSDRRVQFAARRRGAIVMESDRWMRESFAARDRADSAEEAGGLQSEGRGRRAAKPKLKPPDPCPADVAGWLTYFRFDAATPSTTVVSEGWEVQSLEVDRRSAPVEPEVVWGAGPLFGDESETETPDGAALAGTKPEALQPEALRAEAAFDAAAAMEAALGLDGTRLPSDHRAAKRPEKPSPTASRPLRPSPPSARAPVDPAPPKPLPRETGLAPLPLVVPPPFDPRQDSASPATKGTRPPAPARPKTKRPPLLDAGDDFPTLTPPQDVAPLPPVGQGRETPKARRPHATPSRPPRAANEKHSAAMDKRLAAGRGQAEAFPPEMLDEIARLLAAESPGLPPVEPLPPRKKR